MLRSIERVSDAWTFDCKGLPIKNSEITQMSVGNGEGQGEEAGLGEGKG